MKKRPQIPAQSDRPPASTQALSYFLTIIEVVPDTNKGQIIMKNMFFKSLLAVFFICCISSQDIYAQREVWYRCNANKIIARQQPNSRAAYAPYSVQGYEQDYPITIRRGEIVSCDGRKRNGYLHITALGNNVDAGENNYWIQDGWVPAKYFTPAKRCNACRGTGHSKRICPECGGDGCPTVLGGEFTCINGYVYCKYCSGNGYR